MVSRADDREVNCAPMMAGGQNAYADSQALANQSLASVLQLLR
ncbi:hypothetical protein [Bradyrhizobium sp.]